MNYSTQTYDDVIRCILLPKLENIKQEIKEAAYMIKDMKATNMQQIIDYENELNKYSNIDYNTI